VKIIFTLHAKENLQRSISFLRVRSVPEEKIEEIVDDLLFRIESLAERQFLGQYEEYLRPQTKHHRRLIVGAYKIIYYVADGTVYITDIFDSRQNPTHMKG
jgi:plasmid stabilization system protein ParE